MGAQHQSAALGAQPREVASVIALAQQGQRPLAQPQPFGGVAAIFRNNSGIPIRRRSSPRAAHVFGARDQSIGQLLSVNEIAAFEEDAQQRDAEHDRCFGPAGLHFAQSAQTLLSRVHSGTEVAPFAITTAQCNMEPSPSIWIILRRYQGREILELGHCVLEISARLQRPGKTPPDLVHHVRHGGQTRMIQDLGKAATSFVDLSVFERDLSILHGHSQLGKGLVTHAARQIRRGATEFPGQEIDHIRSRHPLAALNERYVTVRQLRKRKLSLGDTSTQAKVTKTLP
jgi:hypothetical protein